MARGPYYRYGTGPKPAATSKPKSKQRKSQHRDEKGRFRISRAMHRLKILVAFTGGFFLASYAMVTKYPAIRDHVVSAVPRSVNVALATPKLADRLPVCLTEEMGRGELAPILFQSGLRVVPCEENPPIKATAIVIPPRPGISEQLQFHFVLFGKVNEDIPTPPRISRVSYKGPHDEGQAYRKQEEALRTLLPPLRDYYIEKIRSAVSRSL